MASINGVNKQTQDISISFGRFVIRHRWMMVILPLLLFAAGAAGLPKAGFNSSYRVFFGKDNPQLLEFDRFQAVYAKDNNVTVVIYHPGKPVFSNEVLETVRDLTAVLWKTDYVTRVDSITNYQHTDVVKDDLIVEDLVSRLPLTEEELRIKEQIALNEPLLAGLLLSHDGRVTQINARVLFPPLDENPNVAREIYSMVEKLVGQERKKHPEIEYRINGIVASNTAFSKTPEDEMKKMMPIMLALIVVSLTVFVRSVWGVLLPLVIVMLSMIFTLGLSGHFGILLTPVSLPSPRFFWQWRLPIRSTSW